VAAHPEIKNDTDAGDAGLWIMTGRVAIRGLETARKEKIEPYQSAMNVINVAYKAIREPLENLVEQLKQRLNVFTTAEEARRKVDAQRMRDRAAMATNEATAASRVAADIASRSGELSVADNAIIANADALIKNAAQAEERAKQAEHDATFRIPTTAGTISMRNKPVLVVEDACAAINAMGLTDGIRKAICISAKEYRKENGRLPDGVTETTERSL
jgi:hypothetical protein